MNKIVVGVVAGFLGLVLLIAVLVAPGVDEDETSAVCDPALAAWGGTATGPVRLPMVGPGVVTSNFGMRVNPGGILKGTYMLHAGIDIDGNGTQIVAAMAGRVVTVRNDRYSGHQVQVDVGSGTRMDYNHLVTGSAKVKVGDTVWPGRLIGTEGATGNVNGVHLHFGIFVGGKATDPRPWMAQHGVTLPAVGGRVTGAPAAAAPPAQSGPGGSTQYVGLGKVQPQTVSVANRVGPMFNIKTVGGYRPPPTSGPNYDPQGHQAGLALDFMTNDIPNGKATGDKVAKYLQDNAGALGVRYIIWYQRVWRAERPGSGWTPMADRGSVTQNHKDHVHVSLHGAQGAVRPVSLEGAGGQLTKQGQGTAAWASWMPKSVGPYGREQVANAAQIIKAGLDMRLDAKAITIAVMTAMGESSLQVLDRGDAAGPDSRGLFQQRDNGAWGSYADRMTPYISAQNFLKVLRTFDYASMPPTLAANRVQRNADANYHGAFWADAVQMVAALTANPELLRQLPVSGGSGLAGPCPEGPSSDPAGDTKVAAGQNPPRFIAGIEAHRWAREQRGVKA
ncbi:M23 family metallopeptidase [Calidifontibacter indicus]|uniref:Peptidase M23-like protein n=1 Tax=Calidifontibacter indicus TaxID=419650 RepID=A0A3D9U580_9MICO|nr:M23 family metallopeptidase [Calidifontibacter indicus]REF24648.1 peptidase M23-like protein [Calidifontibacter indicus]